MCESLCEFVFDEPSCLRIICEYAFSGCSSLSSLTIPRTVELIERNCFLNCKSLESVVLESGSSLNSVGSFAFCGCLSLTQVLIPATVTVLWANCFGKCPSLGSVTIERGSKLTREHVLRTGLSCDVSVNFLE